MKTLYIECAMGAAGDMLTAALLELIEDRESFVNELNELGIPGVEYKIEQTVKCGITGTHMSVTVNGTEENESMHDHEHHHDHEQHHHDYHDHDEHHNHHHDNEEHHHHSSLHDIEHIVRDHLNIPDKVKDDIMSVYELIAEAESHAHNKPVSDIHFHEVGTMDAVADIAAVCLLMNRISPDRVVVSPIHVGSGQVRCAHGILPVPAPATAYILKDVPMYGGSVKGELCTPTGAALLKHFGDSFGDMPVMNTEKIGYGMGKKDFEAANCVRVFLGESKDKTDDIIELECNMDDMSPELIGYAMQKLFDAGALEVYTTAVGMKKSRPGIKLTVLCRPQDKKVIVELIFAHTTTIGIRESSKNRYVLERKIETADSQFGQIRKKVSTGYGVTREKYEYDDIARIANDHDMSIEDVLKNLSQEN